MSIKIGVFGGRRGDSMINWCKQTGEAEVAAICEKDKRVTDFLKKKYPDDKVKYFKDFDEFIKCGLDAVVLANYANEHAPYAIRCLDMGISVLSEVLPCQTLKEAVGLVEAAERSSAVYAYAENYCYMPATLEMKKLYKQGVIGDFEYGEGEYVHNCEPIWPQITYGEKDHWRNNQYSTFYCTHSIGPLVHITGLKPVSVIGAELPFNNAMARMGAKKGAAGIELITFENGAIVKSLHGDLRKNNIWFCMYGTKGRMESVREAALPDGVVKLLVDYDSDEMLFDCKRGEYSPEIKGLGHVGSDFYPMHEFVAKLKGKKADVIGVYEALDMWLPGFFAYISILEGGKAQAIPDLKDKAQRDKYRNDTRCSDKKVAGDMLLPSYSKGEIQTDDYVYEKVRRNYEKFLKENS
ncbi:MAG: Gfo/Idh/MocA family oxidoreductase [Clostridia bacterium]|nr:Gfo/Idh/MocA family oxidoreductase [Clostridia bacterium]